MVSLEAGIALGALFVGVVSSLLVWVWKLRGAIDNAGNQSQPITIPPIAPPCSECKAALEACKAVLIELKPKIEDTHEKTKELAKWQVPSLQKAIGQLAKASEKLGDALEKLERRAP